MRQTALISLLWGKNLNVLHYYLNNRPRLVLAMSQACTPELRDLVEGAGSQLMALDSLISGERRAEIHAEVAAKLARFNAMQTEALWQEFCDQFGLLTDELNDALNPNLAAGLADAMILVEALDRAAE